ncbi:hypothetical protein F5Y15DRAFT_404388 [Xylariaceae sp. FL0016]|nr:hypothetical protein F5Y15DRAFT_404388 [Xylariaceae sp. FL0016]
MPGLPFSIGFDSSMVARNSTARQPFQRSPFDERPQFLNQHPRSERSIQLSESRAREALFRDEEVIGQSKGVFSTFTKRWDNRTFLGALSLISQRTRSFKPGQDEVSSNLFIVHFTPSPWWLSKGIIVTYRSVVSGLADPFYDLKLRTYTVLGDDHGVWRAISAGDIFSLRVMLVQREVSPADRDTDGNTLFHVGSQKTRA